MSTAVIPAVGSEPQAETSSRVRLGRFAIPASAEERMRLVQLVLFAIGAVLMPLGIIVVLLGWYGSAHTPYTYNQTSYLISGGLGGLALTFVGGFLYFGAWLAKINSDQRDSSRQMAEALLTVAELVSRMAPAGTAPSYGAPGSVSSTGPIGAPGGIASGGYASTVEPGPTPVFTADLVLAGPAGTTLHRRDCPLIAHREDLVPTDGLAPNLATCRVCHPTVAG